VNTGDRRLIGTCYPCWRAVVTGRQHGCHFNGGRSNKCRKRWVRDRYEVVRELIPDTWWSILKGTMSYS